MCFPENTSDMPDRIWETYSSLVWCNNSLNAEAGILRHHKIEHLANLLERAQFVITTLLEESGRLEEFDEWKRMKE